MALKYVSKRPSGKKSSHRKLNGKKKKVITKRKRKIYISQPGSIAREGDIIPLHHEILHSWGIANILFKAFTPENFGEKHALKLVEQFSDDNLSETLFTSGELGWLLLLIENYSLRRHICSGLITKQMWSSTPASKPTRDSTALSGRSTRNRRITWIVRNLFTSNREELLCFIC